MGVKISHTEHEFLLCMIFKSFSLNTFDTLKRSKGAQILRLIMTIDLNWFEEKSSSPGHSEIKRSGKILLFSGFYCPPNHFFQVYLHFSTNFYHKKSPIIIQPWGYFILGIMRPPMSGKTRFIVTLLLYSYYNEVVIKVYIHFELIKLVFPVGNSNNLDTKKAYYALYLITVRLYQVELPVTVDFNLFRALS